MTRLLRSALLFTALLTVAPATASAQMSFVGLDLSDDAPKKKGTKKKTPPKKGAKTPPKKEKEPVVEDVTPPPPPPNQPAGNGKKTPPPPPAGGLGLDLSDDPPTGAVTKKKEPPADPNKKEKPAPTMSFDAVDVGGKSAERQRLDAAAKQFKESNYELAALAFAEIMKDPKTAELHDEAEYLLGKTLYRMKMYHSSLGHFKAILAKGPTNKFFKTGLEWLFFIAHKTVNETTVLEEVAKYANQEFPEKFRSEFRYLLSRYHFARAKALDDAQQPEESKKSYGEAKRLIQLVTKSDPFYPRAKYLEGTIYFKEGNFPQALEAFKEVVRTNNPRTNEAADPHLRDLAFMQLARTHYGHKQNRYAIYYYDKVSSGSDQWLEALFEGSWAHFRIGAYERALGNLITLSSPFFKEEYFPEALILKAVIYYENCRYREARAILDEFEKTYLPVHNELEKITSANQDAQKYYDILAEIQKRNAETDAKDVKGHGVILERILKLALTDKDLKQVNDTILEVETEQDSIAQKSENFKYSDLAKAQTEALKKERSTMIDRAGILAKAKLETELGEIKELLGQALRIKFETSSKEKEFLEQQLGGGAKADVVKKYNFSVAVSDEHQYWPYEGEYWRDELGTYEYTLTKGCKGQ